MSTQDVPGFDDLKSDAKQDELHIGVWGEHSDNSLILVEGVEQGRVVFSIFDMSPTPPMEYRDSLPEKQFKSQFSFNSKSSIIKQGWVWHDKTQFPWNKIMDNFPDGTRYPSADVAVNEAQRIAKIKSLRGAIVKKENYTHMMDQIGKKGRMIVDKIQRAVNELRV
jgi:hypothetical protein